MKKKTLALLLAVAMIGGLTACGGDSANNSGGKQGTVSGDLYGYDEPVKIKVGLNFGPNFEFVGDDTAEDNNWMDLYREKNIIPEILYDVDSSQADTKLSTAIMSGNYPDIIHATPSNFVNFARTGVIADITEVFEEYASDYLKEYLQTDGGLSLQNCMVDGKLYGLPMMSDSYSSLPMMWIRADWLENLGLEVPKTMEEFKKVAYAFTHNDPDKNGVDDTYGLALNGVDVLTNMPGDVSAIFAAYNAYPGPNGMAFVEGEDGKVTWGGTNVEGMKAGLKLLQEMYKDGSLAKNFITTNGSSMNEDMGAGRCGIWFGPMWSSMGAAGNALKNDPKAHMIAAPIPTGLGQEQTEVFMAPSLSTVFCVSSKCANPEVLVKLMNLSVQKLCYPESDEEFIKYYGAAGVNTGNRASLTITLAPLKNLDNYKKESAALQTGDTSQLNTEQLGDYTNMKAFLDAYNTGTYSADDPVHNAGAGYYTVFGDPQSSYALIDKLIANDAFKKSAYNSFPTDAMAENAETLKKLTVETIVKIITGDPVDSYDAFLKTWYSLGGEEVIKDAQAWATSNK